MNWTYDTWIWELARTPDMAGVKPCRIAVGKCFSVVVGQLRPSQGRRTGLPASVGVG